MNARSYASLGVTLLCVLAAGLGASAPALATRGHVFEKSFGEPGSGDGQFKEPSGVAINEATGDVYVVDKGNDRVEYFNAAGHFEGQFNGSGLLPGEGQEAGGGGRPGEILTGQFAGPEAIAVDNTCYQHEQQTDSPLSSGECKVLDPSNGDVYVLDIGHKAIDKFSSTGVYVSQITSDEHPFDDPPEGVHGIAVGTDGELWVAREYGRPNEDYSERGFVNFNNAIDNQFIKFQENGKGQSDLALAANSDDDLYLRESFNSTSTDNEEFDSNDQYLQKFYSEEPSSGLAIELSSDDIYIDEIGRITRLAPAGSLIERFETPGMQGSGIAVISANEDVYVADSSAGVVHIFAPEPPSKPTVTDASASAVTSDSVTLSAEINANGLATEYHFEYGLCASPATCSTSGYEASALAPEDSLGASFEAREVSVLVQGLSADETYHFRVVAGNNDGTVYGEEATLTTERSGGSVSLLDGRSFELVTPANKDGALFFGQDYGNFGFVSADPFVAEASADGDAMINFASQPTEAEPQGNTNEVSVLSTRGSQGWSSQTIAPPHAEGTGPSLGNGGEYRFFSEDLSHGIVTPFGNFDALSPEATEATPYLRTNYLNGNVNEHCQTSCYRPLVTAADTLGGAKFGEERNGECEYFVCGPHLVDATPDASHIVLSASTQLTSIPNAGNGRDFYEWSDGQLQPLYLLPKGEGGVGVYAGALSQVNHQLSNGGSVFFSYGGHLYLHDFATDESVRWDVAQGVEEPSEGDAQFLDASSDGSRVLFTDSKQLTSSSGGGVYECRIVEEAGATRCELELTGLTDYSLIGGSDDASYLYFLSSEGKLIVDHYVEGRWTTALGPLIGPEIFSTAKNHPGDYRVSANGDYLAFMSDEDLADYDTRDAVSGHPDEEVYLYDARANRLVCASCERTGGRPIGVASNEISLVGGDFGAGTWVASNLPPWTKALPSLTLYQPRFLSDSGRLFFDSNDALVPQDVNGAQDTYEYEPPGVGNCDRSSETYSEHSGGCVDLISSGTSPEESAFMDASETGGDVFFITLAKLIPQDYDAGLDVYDAHECTTEVPCYPVAPVSPPACFTGDSCKAAPTPQPSIFGPTSSATFSGAGNVSLTNPAPAVKQKSLSRAQKLTQALKACSKKSRKRRSVCERQARKKYGPGKKSIKASSKPKGGK